MMPLKKWGFYNRHYAKYGQYDGAQLVSSAQYPNGDPEVLFGEIIINLGLPNKTPQGIWLGRHRHLLAAMKQNQD